MDSSEKLKRKREMEKTAISRVSLTLISFILSLMLAFGCSTVNPQPFSRFSDSVQELRKGADAALQFNDEENRAWFLEKSARDIGDPTLGADAIKGLAIKGEEFSWHMEPTPLFMASKRFRKGVYRLNTVLINYSELLRSISASELVDVKEFETLAADLNANLKSAAKSMKMDLSEGVGKGIAIFSVAASTAARLAVESKRKHKLIEALKKNQEQIGILSAKLQGAALIAAENLWDIYEDHKRILFKQLFDVKDKPESQRKKMVEEFLAWNEDFVHRLNVLESIHDAYGALPNAHRELAEALEKPDTSLEAINELFEHGKHLYDLYKDLSQ
jgi:hypothetical protein